MRRLLPILLLVATALVGCSDDDSDDSEPAAASSPATAEPATCARISATDLSAEVGEDLVVQDVSDQSGIEGATVCSAVGTSIVVDWVVEPTVTTPPTEISEGTTTRVSVQGEAADGRTTTASVLTNSVLADGEVDSDVLRQGAEAVVAAYAEEGEPSPEGDQCHVLSDADVSALAGFPVEVRDQEVSGGDLTCTTLVGDGEDLEGLATLKWSLTQPSETLTAAAGRAGRPTEAITLPGGQPAVISYESGRAVVAAQAGERTIVVDVDALVDEDVFSEARVRELAGDIADVYAG